MWDPITLKVNSHLQGHESTIQDLALNIERDHLISVSVTKEILIWDIKTYHCVQKIMDIQIYRPENIFTAILYDNLAQQLLLGTRKLNQWFFKTQDNVVTTHDSPVIFALYSTEFNQIITGDNMGVICIWNMKTGQLNFRFVALGSVIFD